MKRFLLSIFCLVLSHCLVMADGVPVKTLELGAPAPKFKLPGVDGKQHSLNDYKKAKVLVIVFTCVHCPTAQAYEDRLMKVVEDYKSKGLQVVAISPNDPKSVRLDELGYTDLGDSLADMKTRAAYKKLNYPFLYDGDKEEISHAYGPTATPHAFVFDAERKLRYVGRIDDSERVEYAKTHELRDALDALLAGREIEVKQTKAFGCSIKWAVKEETVRKFTEKLAAEPVSVDLVDAEGLKALRKNESGNLRLVNFWATWCGPCVVEFPELVTINRMYRKRAFEMVTVAANFPDEKNEVLAFLKKEQSSGRNLLFGDTDKYKMMAAFDKDWDASLPYTVLISPEGQILYQKSGEINPLELKRMIVKSLKYDRK